METSMAASAVRAMVALVLLASPGIAQRRAPLLGIVRDPGGAAVAGARVTVVEDDPDLAGIEPLDVCEATTDARGRFKVDALCGVRYVAIAVGPELEGCAAVAQPVFGVGCGRNAELVLSQHAVRRNVAAHQLAAHGAFADLQLRCLLPHVGGHALPMVLGAGGEIELLPLAASGVLELRDRAGAFLAEVFAAPGDTAAIAPAPRAIRVRVVDGKGRAVAGARVTVQSRRSRDGGAWTPVSYVAREGPAAVTGADGMADVLCAGWSDPFDDPPEELLVVAGVADGREGVSGWASKQLFKDWQVGGRHQGRTVHITVPDDGLQRGTAAGAGVVGRTARAFVTGLAHQQQAGALRRWYVRRARDVAIAADGTFSLPLPAAHTGDVTLLTPRIDGKRVFWLPGRNGALPQLDLATCEPLAVRVIDATGGPAHTAELLLVPADCSDQDLAHAIPLVTDPAGRVDVLLQRGRWTLLAADATHWASVELDDAGSPTTLTLAPKPSMRVRVIATDGAPVAGARFELGQFPYAPPLHAGIDAVLATLGWNTFANEVRRTRTDANGDATLRWLPWPGARPTVFAFAGDHSRRSDDVAVTADDTTDADPAREPLRIVLRP